MKKFPTLVSALALVLLIALTLTACGGSGDDPGDSSGNGSSVTPSDNLGDDGSAKAQIGDIIQLGGHDWRVLDVQDGKALVISEGILFDRPYNSIEKDITWEECDLRQFLNGTYYDRTFSDEEKEKILETTVINDDNPTGTPGGNDTTDKLFLLSIDEANNYFFGDDERIAMDENGKERAWFLRSPGEKSDLTAIVFESGRVQPLGFSFVAIHHSHGIRPALWLEL
jgi:hypothetical protein